MSEECRPFLWLLEDIVEQEEQAEARMTPSGKRLFERAKRILKGDPTERACKDCVRSIIEDVRSWPVPMPEYFGCWEKPKALYLRGCEAFGLDPQTRKEQQGEHP